MAAPTLAASDAPPLGGVSSQDHLIRIADEFDRAQLSKDAAALDQMVDDDLVFITSKGKRVGKKEFIAGWVSPGDRYDPIRLVDRKLVLLGSDGFMVSAETVLSGVSEGAAFSSKFRFTDTFRLIGGTWRAVHIQVTPISS